MRCRFIRYQAIVALGLCIAVSFGHAFVLFQKQSSTAFTVSDESWISGEDHVYLKVLSNSGGERVSVLLNAGGGIDELWLKPKGHKPAQNGTIRNVLWSHDRNATQALANPTWKGRMLLPYGNRIGGAKYTFNGTEHHLPINDVAGLNNSLHGLLWDRTMHVASSSADDTHASVILEYTFNAPGEQPAQGYPFALKVAIEYTLTEGRFEVAVRATNLDVGGWPLPFYNGWHPYFLCHPCSAALIVLDTASQWRHVDVAQGPQFPPPRHSNMVPTTHMSSWDRSNGSDPIGPALNPPGAPLYMDDEVKAMSRPSSGFYTTKLVDPATSQAVLLNHDSDMRYLQIFTGAKASFPTTPVDAVVLEPLSAMSDGFNNHDGLHTISAGETYVSRFGVEVE